MTMRLGAILLAVVALISSGHAQPPPTANTVEIVNGPLAGETVSVSVNGSPACNLGDRYALQLHTDGTLAFYGHLDCGALKNVGGGKSFCPLDEDFHCTSRLAADSGLFTVDEDGVSHNGQTYRWVDKRQAVAMFPAVKKEIAWVCDNALHREAVARQQKQSLKDDSPGHRFEDCQAMLHRLCAAEKNGKVLTESGKDITVLCR